MSQDLQITLVKKEPHKVFKADIKAEDHIASLCKFLRDHKDKKIEVIINGKSFVFNSVSGRKRFAMGFQYAFQAITPFLEQSLDELEGRLNGALSERDKARAESKALVQRYNQATDRYRTKYTVMNLRTAAWKDMLAEQEDNCKYLQEQVDILTKRLEKKDGSNQ